MQRRGRWRGSGSILAPSRAQIRHRPWCRLRERVQLGPGAAERGSRGICSSSASRGQERWQKAGRRGKGPANLDATEKWPHAEAISSRSRSGTRWKLSLQRPWQRHRIRICRSGPGAPRRKAPSSGSRPELCLREQGAPRLHAHCWPRVAPGPTNPRSGQEKHLATSGFRKAVRSNGHKRNESRGFAAEKWALDSHLTQQVSEAASQDAVT